MSSSMSDSDFINHVLWLVADGAEAYLATRLRAARLAQARCIASYAAAAGAEAGCTAEFPCHHCTDCDARIASWSGTRPKGVS